MIFTGITPDQVADIVARVSRERYEGNVVPEWVKRGSWPSLLNDRGTRFRGRITVYHSRMPGARRSWSGRHGPWACWHVFRDVIGPILESGARSVSTGMARYTPLNWEETYPETGRRNVGSMIDPAMMPDLCDCPHPGHPYRLSENENYAPAELARPVPVERHPNGEGRLVSRFEPYARETHMSPASPLSTGQLDIDGLLNRIDKVLNGAIEVASGVCMSCGNKTGSPDMFWCSLDCQFWFSQKQGERN